jgi:hypothetical protein
VYFEANFAFARWNLSKIYLIKSLICPRPLWQRGRGEGFTPL